MTCAAGRGCRAWLAAAVAARRVRIEWVKAQKTKRAGAPTPAGEETT